MLLNEHLSKTLLKEAAGIPVPTGVKITTKDLPDLEPYFPLPWILKAQVPVGGRGKAGGIKKIESKEEYETIARQILSMEIKGNKVPFLRAEPAIDIRQEFYLSLTLSRQRRKVMMTVGREGGVEIENMGPENLLVQEIGLPGGLHPNQIRAAFFHIGIARELFADFSLIVTNLYKTMIDYGLLLAEINPLALTGYGKLLALDGKIEMDDNIVDINPAFERFYQPEHSTREENMARDAGMSFVSLKGWVGLIANGAGLAMASMDALNFSDLPAANFLDLGGAADQKRIETALDLLFNDKQVGAIFINLFGGILSCELVAKALVAALGGKEPEKPIVVRMSGNSAEKGLKILKDINSDKLHRARNMHEAIETLRSLKPTNAQKITFAPPISAMPEVTIKDVGYKSSSFFEINKDTPILVQGITGHEGRLHTRLMLEYGSNIVAGVTPFKGGQEVLGVPVYNSIKEAQLHHEIGASIIFVPPKLAADAILEAASCEIPWVVCITEGIVQSSMLNVLEQIKGGKTRVVGPNTPGLIVPGQTKIGILPTTPFSPGPVAVLSRSGTLTYEVADRLNQVGIGQSLSVGIGGDSYIGTTFADMFEMLRNHDETKAVMVLGEIGGTAEQDLADYVIKTGFDKPVLSFIAGQTAPPGKRLGHAGAILQEGTGVQGKLEKMRSAGFTVCPSLESIPQLTADALGIKL
ncbi:succinate--CoA ligase subunit alpha [Desulfovibrio gilichinskyi]|uniref:Succinyl-CoA synthetase (ADP-forming) alpha subunit /succinyl-CoA synthetase (ADP-forming) beta subunit n=1 Tax=Desulfovibrio gilichinskyi TaxID=1519643 RepID=A0A1X7CB06_9BACT|nr:succinate--CoA ligase subunit alpha [Desulfovibrio gilichinskyi]SME92995.1 succinyl-CoA synthetase (ADP-forming) alpha subunit /succinyl-CoA synthetase (ADP-forming) beta subunit [Desulfovibrio gilichinskyi]